MIKVFCHSPIGLRLSVNVTDGRPAQIPMPGETFPLHFGLNIVPDKFWADWTAQNKPIVDGGSAYSKGMITLVADADVTPPAPAPQPAEVVPSVGAAKAPEPIKEVEPEPEWTAGASKQAEPPAQLQSGGATEGKAL